MAHYAFLDPQGIVVSVIVGKDESVGTDWESYYGAKAGRECKRTSYNTRGGIHIKGGTPYRKNYAGKGYRYDSVRDAFIPPQPHPSWALNEDTCTWVAPQPRPEGDGIWVWSEETGAWVDLSNQG